MLVKSVRAARRTGAITWWPSPIWACRGQAIYGAGVTTDSAGGTPVTKQARWEEMAHGRFSHAAWLESVAC
jgi:hypothetical protein